MSQSTSSSIPTATSTPTASTGSLRVAASRFLWNKILRRKSNALSSIWNTWSTCTGRIAPPTPGTTGKATTMAPLVMHCLVVHRGKKTCTCCVKKNYKGFPPQFVLALKPLIPAQCRVPLGSNKVSGTTLGWEQGKVRGQVGGWLYIACRQTGGLGSNDTRARRAGRARSDRGSDWRGTESDWRGERGRTEGERGRTGENGVGLGGNGVGLEGRDQTGGGRVRLRGERVGLGGERGRTGGGTGSDWGGEWGRTGEEQGRTGGERGRTGGGRGRTGWGTGSDWMGNGVGLGGTKSNWGGTRSDWRPSLYEIKHFDLCIRLL